MSTTTPTQAVALLYTCGHDVPPAVREAILAAGQAAVPPLLAILEDEQVDVDFLDIDQGWAATNAVALLADIGDTRAIEPMLALLDRPSPDDAVHGQVILHLPRFGAEVLEPALAAHARTSDPLTKEAIASVLANLGIRDERSWAAIRESFDFDPLMSIARLVAYGDERALELAKEKIESTDPTSIELRDYVHVYETLAIALSAREERVHELGETWKRHHAAAQSKGLAKVGRNDPCPCASGKKHKKCCLGTAPSAGLASATRAAIAPPVRGVTPG